MSGKHYETIAGSRTINPEHPLDAWYDLARNDHFWMAWRNQALLALFAASQAPANRPLKVMDIGCGNGTVIECLENNTQWIIDGVEVDAEALQRARTGRGRLLLYDITLRHEPMAQAYDVVYLLDVLEHIPDPAAFLDSALFHLKPGGYLAVNVPALQNLHGIYDRASGHLRRYGKATLRAAFNGLDAEVLDIRYWGMSLIPLVILRELLLSRKSNDSDILHRGFSPPSRAANTLLTLIMRMETALIKRPPIGASLMLLARKRSSGDT